MNLGALTLLGSPGGMARGKDGAMYVLDGANDVIRKVTANGDVADFAGASGFSGLVDGVGAEARLGGTQGLAIDASGTLYFADYGRLRTVSPKGEVKTLDKAQLLGSDDVELKRSWMVWDLAAAPDGSLYFLDGARVMRLKDGKVSVVAGSFDARMSWVDGPATQARFGRLGAITVRSNGQVLVLDSCYGVRKIDPDGTVGTVIRYADQSQTPENTSSCYERGRSLSTAADGRVLMLWDVSLRVIEPDDTVRILRRLVRVKPDGETTTLLTLPEQTSAQMTVTPSGQLLLGGLPA